MLYLSSEDQRKLHAEINQLAGQTVILNMGAIALFGALIACVFPKDTQSLSVISNVTILGCVLLIIVLMTLFLIGHTYLKMLRFIASYLLITKCSTWEKDYKKYCDKYGRPHFQYSETRTMLFLTLGGIASMLPWLLHWSTNKPFQSESIAYILVFLYIIYSVVVFILGFQSGIKIGDKANIRWKEYFDENPIQLGDNSSDKTAKPVNQPGRKQPYSKT